MAGDLTVGLDMIAAATVPTKPAARLLWGRVASTASPVQVVLENDASGTARPVSGNASGPVAMGDRVLLARQRRRLTIVANPTAQARLMMHGPWVSCALSSGFTGTCSVRRAPGGWVELNASVTGTFAQGYVTFGNVPAAYAPSVAGVGTEVVRGAARLSDEYEGTLQVRSADGLLSLVQRSGASRTSVATRMFWPLP